MESKSINLKILIKSFPIYFRGGWVIYGGAMELKILPRQKIQHQQRVFFLVTCKF